jgi:hypothetical protein
MPRPKKKKKNIVGFELCTFRIVVELYTVCLRARTQAGGRLSKSANLGIETGIIFSPSDKHRLNVDVRCSSGLIPCDDDL